MEMKKFEDLPPEIIKEYLLKTNGGNWQTYGPQGSDERWEKLADPQWLTIHRMAVLKENGTIKFDKINIVYRGAFALPVRRNNGRVEVGLVKEFRVLLNTDIENIVQGALRPEETLAEAAFREAEEEVKIKPSWPPVLIGRIALDPSNSESIQDLFLVYFPSITTAGTLDQDEDEQIRGVEWRTLRDCRQSFPSLDVKTLAALYLAESVLEPQQKPFENPESILDF